MPFCESSQAGLMPSRKMLMSAFSVLLHCDTFLHLAGFGHVGEELPELPHAPEAHQRLQQLLVVGFSAGFLGLGAGLRARGGVSQPDGEIAVKSIHLHLGIYTG